MDKLMPISSSRAWHQPASTHSWHIPVCCHPTFKVTKSSPDHRWFFRFTFNSHFTVCLSLTHPLLSLTISDQWFSVFSPRLDHEILSITRFFCHRGSHHPFYPCPFSRFDTNMGGWHWAYCCHPFGFVRQMLRQWFPNNRRFLHTPVLFHDSPKPLWDVKDNHNQESWWWNLGFVLRRGNRSPGDVLSKCGRIWL